MRDLYRLNRNELTIIKVEKSILNLTVLAQSVSFAYKGAMLFNIQYVNYKIKA